jgi:hypothetical protein
MIDLPIISDNLTGYAVSGSLNFNTSLEYVPALLIPKLHVHKLHNYVMPDVFREGSRDFRFKPNDWDPNKRMSKSNDLQSLLKKTNLSLLYFDYLRQKDSLLKYTEVTDNLNHVLNNFNYSVSNSKQISSKFSYYGINDMVDKFSQNSLNLIRSYEHRSRTSSVKTSWLVDNGFVATGQEKINICYATMIKKDYVEEYILLKLLGLPIDNSKIQIWYNNENALLDQDSKKVLSKFTSASKKSGFEIVSKENLNCLINSFKVPKFATISQVKEFDLVLTANVMKELYDLDQGVPELKLELDNSPINTVKLKGIRIPKPKVIIPELVD